MSKKQFIFISSFLIFSCSLLGQTLQEKILLVTALDEISKNYDIQFNYKAKLVSGIKIAPISYPKTTAELIPILNRIPQLKFTIIGDRIVVIEKVSSSFGSSKLILPKVEELSPVNLTGYLVKGIDKKEGVITVNHSKFSILPGLIETDILQSLQALPGIQSIDERVSNTTIRGGSNDQNLILWDDIKMYNSGHFFGLISSFNPLITAQTSLHKNGTDASYTDGVSGMIKMQTQDTLNTILKGSLGVNFLNATAFVDIPTSKKSSLQIAGRKSISDLIETPTYVAYFNRITQNTEVEGNLSNSINSNKQFDFHDASFRWLYTISKKDFLRVNFLTITNNLEFKESAIVESGLRQLESSLSQQSYAGGIFYKRNWNKKFTTHFSVYETDYLLKAINANVLDSQSLLQKNSVSETGIRLMGDYAYSTQLKWLNGYQIIETEITNLNDIDVPRFKELKSHVLRSHSLFSQINYKSKNKILHVKTGLRLNYLDKFRKFILEPRFGLNRKFSNNFKMELLGEFKHQNTSQIINFQNDFLGIEKRRWQLADNDSIPITKSKQLSLGTTYTKSGWLIDVDTYYKKVNGITTQSQGFNTKYEFEKTAGSYTAFGVDALIRKRFNVFNSWLSYSFINNDYIFKSLEEVTFPSNFDVTHTLSLGTTFLIKQLKLSGGVNLKTGKPTTLISLLNPIVNNEINFLSANQTRLNTYFRTDFSAIYSLKINAKYKLETGASIWNIIDSKNTINNYYRISNGQVKEFQQQALGTTFNCMLRIQF